MGQQTISHYMHASDHGAGGKDDADDGEADGDEADSDTDKAGIKNDALERQSNYSQWWWEGISEVLMIPQLLFKPSRAC